MEGAVEPTGLVAAPHFLGRRDNTTGAEPRETNMVAVIKQFWNDESGQGLPEYALLVAAVVVMVIAATTLFADDVQGLFNNIGDYITDNDPTGSAT